jgi:hypothetical protein
MAEYYFDCSSARVGENAIECAPRKTHFMS